jgi:hypothetical protein
MNSLKTLAILFSAVLLLSSKCNKKNTVPGVLKGRVMVNCTTPYANKEVSVQAPAGFSKLEYLEDANGNSVFYTDEDGYFEITYVTKKVHEGTLFAPYSAMTGIPLGEGQNLDIGEVILNGTVNFVIKLQVNNPYTANDTLLIRDFNGSSIYSQLRIPGPFQSGIIDTVWNEGFISYPISYNKVPEFSFVYYFSNNPTVGGHARCASNFCTNTLSEAIITIN